ncbi:hypothetical protein Tcan_07648 [Toxocara canis]|uniref:Uncharacterized protein n=1 Tax=Toxocara canis TaxID=6265 RepID=A0A0B2V8X2_TOXCA|nr:hypothetical protein Tcan_07648 [Toxocara canis]
MQLEQLKPNSVIGVVKRRTRRLSPAAHERPHPGLVLDLTSPGIFGCLSYFIFPHMFDFSWYSLLFTEVCYYLLLLMVTPGVCDQRITERYPKRLRFTKGSRRNPLNERLSTADEIRSLTAERWTLCVDSKSYCTNPTLRPVHCASRSRGCASESYLKVVVEIK